MAVIIMAQSIITIDSIIIYYSMQDSKIPSFCIRVRGSLILIQAIKIYIMFWIPFGSLIYLMYVIYANVFFNN